MGLLAVDRTGVVRTVNGAAERLFGKTRRFLLGMPLEKLLPGHPVALDLITRSRKLAMPCRFRNAHISPSPGVLLSVSLTTIPLLDENKESDGAILQLEEVGDAKRLEDGQRLSDTLDSLGNLALAVAHEVKNPLAGIRGAAQLLELETSGEAAAGCTDLIRTEVDRVTRLLDTLLGLADDHPLPEQDLNIHEVLDHVARMCGQNRPTPILRDYDPSLPAIRGDRDQLVQLFLNLCKNATEAAGEAGKVGFHTRMFNRVRFEQGRRRYHIMVEVRDDGPGVAPELRQRIFLPFVSTKNKSRGSGLGLAISQKIVHDHGGLVEVNSQPGATVFRILLPVPGS